MKAEFLKDENGNIWFFYAHHINTRPAKNKAAALYEVRNLATQSQANASAQNTLTAAKNQIMSKDKLLEDIEEY